jgi:hypothetical protein
MPNPTLKRLNGKHVHVKLSLIQRRKLVLINFKTSTRNVKLFKHAFYHFFLKSLNFSFFFIFNTSISNPTLILFFHIGKIFTISICISGRNRIVLLVIYKNIVFWWMKFVVIYILYCPGTGKKIKQKHPLYLLFL